MADNNVAFNIEINGVEQEIKSVKDLKKAIKEATDEQLRASEKFGIGSKEYANASKKVSELRDKVDDLKDATKSLQGSGIERASQGFNQLGEGLRNLDFDKVKVGLTAMKSALAATGIGLIVALVSTLAEKFDIFGKITEVVTDIIYGFTDALGLTNKAAEEATKSMVENMDSQKKAIEERYNAEMKLAKAAGKDTTDLEIQKLKELENSTKEQIAYLQVLAAKKSELNEDEKKQYKELQDKLLVLSSDRQAKEIENERAKQLQLQKLGDLEEKLRVAGLSAREREIDAIKKQQESLLKELNENHKVRLGNELKDTIRYNDDVKKINELTQKQINEVNAKYYKEDAEKRKKIKEESMEFDIWMLNQQLKNAEELRKIEAEKEKQLKQQQALDEIEIENNTNATILNFDQLKKDAKQRDFENYLTALKDDKQKQFEIEQNALNSFQQLSDVYFLFRSQKLTKGTQEEEKVLRKQFQINKALQIAQATIAGFNAVQNTFATASASPITGVFPAYPFIQAGLAGIFSAIPIAKIAATQFQSSGGGGGGGSIATASVPIPAPPTINTPNANTGTSTLFDQTGQATGNDAFRTGNTESAPVKAYVVETEITSKQKDIKTITEQATF